MENKKFNLKPLYKVALVEKDGKHFYSIDDKKTLLPGVTGILNSISKPYLMRWAASETSKYIHRQIQKVKKFDGNIPDDKFFEILHKRAIKQSTFIKDLAAKKGSNAHEKFDLVIKNPRKEVSGSFIDSFFFWLEKEKLTIVNGDMKIASLKYGYGGSLDALAVDEYDHFVIIDFKTGKSIHESHAFQIAAYSQAFMETYGIGYRPKGVVLRFVETNKQYERREVANIDDSFLAFKAALDMTNALKLIHFKNRELIKKEKLKK